MLKTKCTSTRVCVSFLADQNRRGDAEYEKCATLGTFFMFCNLQVGWQVGRGGDVPKMKNMPMRACVLFSVGRRLGVGRGIVEHKKRATLGAVFVFCKWGEDSRGGRRHEKCDLQVNSRFLCLDGGGGWEGCSGRGEGG